eukprot:11080846-Lingulodinium_polyedra.AAC.1
MHNQSTSKGSGVQLATESISVASLFTCYRPRGMHRAQQVARRVWHAACHAQEVPGPALCAVFRTPRAARRVL